MSPTIVLANAASAGLSLWWSLAPWLPAIAMIAGILILGVVMMVFFHRREQQLKAIAAQIAGDLEEARALRVQLEEVHVRASNMMVTAQRLAARLDERVAALDLASLRMSATRNALPRVAPAAALAPSVGPAPALPLARQRAAGAALAGQEMEATLLSGAAAESTPALLQEIGPNRSVQPAPTAEVDPLTRRVYELADAGRTPLAIARDLNEQVGKIELILALRRQSNAA